MQTFEDMLYNIANEALNDKFLALIEEREDEINKVIDEIFTTEMLKDWLEDFITYGDDFRAKVMEIAEEEIMKKVKGVLK